MVLRRNPLRNPVTLVRLFLLLLAMLALAWLAYFILTGRPDSPVY